MARLATERLLRILAGAEEPADSLQLLRPSLVRRASSGPAPAAAEAATVRI